MYYSHHNVSVILFIANLCYLCSFKKIIIIPEPKSWLVGGRNNLGKKRFYMMISLCDILL